MSLLIDGFNKVRPRAELTDYQDSGVCVTTSFFDGCQLCNPDIGRLGVSLQPFHLQFYLTVFLAGQYPLQISH